MFLPPIDGWANEAVQLPESAFAIEGYSRAGLALVVTARGSMSGRQPRWSLTHLASGARVAVLVGWIGDVAPVATAIADAGDWGFAAADGWRDRFPEAPVCVRAILAAAHQPAIPPPSPTSSAR